MATIVLTPDLQRFPVGTSVGAYPRTAWPADRLTGAPSGAAAETQAVQANGTLTFTTLTPNLDYVGYVASPDRYMPFSIRSRQQLQAFRANLGAFTASQTRDVPITLPAAYGVGDTSYTVAALLDDTINSANINALRQIELRTNTGFSVKVSAGSVGYADAQLFGHFVVYHD